jgi:hypothetical protein
MEDSKLLSYWDKYLRRGVSGDSTLVGICLHIISHDLKYEKTHNSLLLESKVYKLEDRWAILDYLTLPESLRNYLDTLEGETVNLNVRIISDESYQELLRMKDVLI